jgi:hypothetical protein
MTGNAFHIGEPTGLTAAIACCAAASMVVVVAGDDATGLGWAPGLQAAIPPASTVVKAPAAIFFTFPPLTGIVRPSLRMLQCLVYSRLTSVASGRRTQIIVG